MSIYSIATNARARERRVEASEIAGEAMNSSKGRSDPSPYLGVNKIGKIIQKPSFSSSSSSLPPPPPPPQNVYTISMRDFRSVVQQLTAGTPSAPRPPRPSSPPRFRKIRPPPLPLASPSPRLPPPPPPPAPAESPVSAYMRFLTSDAAAAPSPRLPFPSPLPSPSAFLNLLSPKSPCSLLSPLPPLPPLSPGFSWPPSPSAFPPILSPTWKDHM